MNSERTRYSPVICWTSEWQGDRLKIKKINKESSGYQKALDKLAVEQTWKGKKNV